MKIGIDIRAIGRKRTGDETYTLNLVRNLLRIDSQNQYRLYTDTANLIEIDQIKNKIGPTAKKNFEIVSVLPSQKFIWTPLAIAKEIFKRPVDIFHTQYIVPPILPSKTKIVTTIHDISFARYPQFISRKDLFLLKFLIPFSIQKADQVIAVSKFTQTEIVDFYEAPKEKTTVVYNGGAEEDFFKPLPLAKIKKTIQKLGIGSDYILYTGTLQPRKNIPFLLKAFAEFQRRYMGQFGKMELVITGEIGGHNYDQEIGKTLEEIKKRNLNVFKSIKLIGFVDKKDLLSLFQGAKVFASASLYEGFGLPLIEAMASGTPVVCTREHCFPEIAGGAALYFSKDNVGEFCQRLFELLTDEEKREEVIKRGKIQAREFSWEKCAQETLAVYEKVLQKNRRK